MVDLRDRTKAMTDGLYRVKTPYLCAGFVVEGGKVVRCAPILRKRIEYWRTVAKLAPVLDRAKP